MAHRPLLAGERRRGSAAGAGAEDIWNSDAVTISHKVSYDVEAAPVPQLMELFSSAWWAARRTEAEIGRILAESDVVVMVFDHPSGRLVGFARVLTDKTYLAIILDVIVAPDVRGAGIGSAIMDATLAHPSVAHVQSIEVVCQPDLIAFYRQWNFTDQVGQSRLMRRTADPLLTSEL